MSEKIAIILVFMTCMIVGTVFLYVLLCTLLATCK